MDLSSNLPNTKRGGAGVFAWALLEAVVDLSLP
jgi:hypothetical protein